MPIPRHEHVYFRSLPEEHGRRHAAVEALKNRLWRFRVCGASVGDEPANDLYGNRQAGGHGQRGSPPHSVPVAVPSASAVLAVVVAKSPNANRGCTSRLLDTLYELGRKCSETSLDINDKFIRRDPVLGK